MRLPINKVTILKDKWIRQTSMCMPAAKPGIFASWGVVSSPPKDLFRGSLRICTMDKNVWMLRETGVTIGVPELFGNIFIGRTKEGFMVKVMNGHSPWTNERQMALDPIPILADGIKWMGFLPKPGIFWNLGAYTNVASKTQTFATFSSHYVARVGWLPVNNTKTNNVFHIALNFRYGKPKNDKFTIKSRPEFKSYSPID